MSKSSESCSWFSSFGSVFLEGFVCEVSIGGLVLSYLVEFFSLCSVFEAGSLCGDLLLKRLVSWFYGSLLDSFAC